MVCALVPVMILIPAVLKLPQVVGEVRSFPLSILKRHLPKERVSLVLNFNEINYTISKKEAIASFFIYYYFSCLAVICFVISIVRKTLTRWLSAYIFISLQIKTIWQQCVFASIVHTYTFTSSYLFFTNEISVGHYEDIVTQ